MLQGSRPLTFLKSDSRLRKRFLSKMSVHVAEKSFCLNDYDVIGLDLDHTVVRYHLRPLSKLTFQTLTRYLVEKKSFPLEIQGLTYEESNQFFVKGLLLDKQRGNFLRLAHNHVILKATHGTKTLSQLEIQKIYGSERIWAPTVELLELLCQPKASRHPFFLFRDFFVVMVPYIVARTVDLLDANPKARWCRSYYDIWEDVLEAIVDMYRRDAFQKNEGSYFPAIRQEPSQYLVKCDQSLLDWFKTVHHKKKLFLLTSSHVDYANKLMSHCIGPKWRDYFDLVVTFARKPGFFIANRPFLKLDGETETTDLATLSRGGLYSQGNWKELKSFFAKECGKSEPQIVYVGDSLIDDVFCPSAHTSCHSIAIVEEMAAEGMEGFPSDHPATSELTSEFWGSFFACSTDKHETLLGKTIRTHAKIAVPYLSTLAQISLKQQVPSFSGANSFSGYYPAVPLAYKNIKT